jgi:hypothetical protein
MEVDYYYGRTFCRSGGRSDNCNFVRNIHGGANRVLFLQIAISKDVVPSNERNNLASQCLIACGLSLQNLRVFHSIRKTASATRENISVKI